MFKGLGDKIKGLAGDEMMKYVKGLNFLETKPDVESAFKARAIGALSLRNLGTKFRFRLKAANGEIIAVSEGYTFKESCVNGKESVYKLLR
jgi:hypothetical protein